MTTKTKNQKALNKKATLHLCTNHTGKMAGMWSLSTSTLENKYCKKYASNPRLICSHCYAQRQLKVYKSLENVLKENTKLLTESIIDPELLPFVNCAFFRFESFGDLNNDIQVINYFNICNKNKHCTFALWTKNPFIIAKALRQIAKPKNLIIVLSSPMINKPIDINNTFKWVDKVFTVYDKDHTQKNNININCGARSCLGCLNCYKKTGAKVINELVK